MTNKGNAILDPAGEGRGEKMQRNEKKVHAFEVLKVSKDREGKEKGQRWHLSFCSRR